jgi:prepilin-type processing-associated H-X9-DG protein
MLEQLPLEQEQRAQLSRIVSDLVAVLPKLYQSLPQQAVYRDFNASNVLMADGSVSGVLDFEFAGSDLRAYDLARSLSMFTISPWNIPYGWQ